MQIRRASPEDSQAIASIYGHYILHTEFTFDTELLSPDEFIDKIIQSEHCHAFIVAEEEGHILGFAFTSPYKSKKAYQWIAEIGIYMDAKVLSRGTGRLLYTALLKLAEYQNYASLLAGITTPNVRSERLHSSFGFRPSYTYENIGFKIGQWRQVVWWRKDFLSFNEAPEPIRSLNDLSTEEFMLCGLSV